MVIEAVRHFQLQQKWTRLLYCSCYRGHQVMHLLCPLQQVSYNVLSVPQPFHASFTKVSHKHYGIHHINPVLHIQSAHYLYVLEGKSYTCALKTCKCIFSNGRKTFVHDKKCLKKSNHRLIQYKNTD